MQKFAAGKFHHLYARGQRVARERAEMIDEGRCPPTAWALPWKKGFGTSRWAALLSSYLSLAAMRRGGMSPSVKGFG
jgi:hypothetical protein